MLMLGNFPLERGSDFAKCYVTVINAGSKCFVGNNSYKKLYLSLTRVCVVELHKLDI